MHTYLVDPLLSVPTTTTCPHTDHHRDVVLRRFIPQWRNTQGISEHTLHFLAVLPHHLPFICFAELKHYIHLQQICIIQSIRPACRRPHRENTSDVCVSPVLWRSVVNVLAWLISNESRSFFLRLQIFSIRAVGQTTDFLQQGRRGSHLFIGRQQQQHDN